MGMQIYSVIDFYEKFTINMSANNWVVCWFISIEYWHKCVYLDTTVELFLVFFLESFMQFSLRTTLILHYFDWGFIAS